MDWILEENYAQAMEDRARPYVEARRTEGWDERVEGQKIYYWSCRADQPKGVIVLVHGFTESVRKYTESIYYMLQAGYDVWGIDVRGHGRSFRHNGNPYIVHVLRFEDYIEDLRHLVETKVLPSYTGRNLPLYVYGHSMGGCISARTIETYPTLFQKAVLTSPMLGLSFGSVPPALVRIAGVFLGMKSHRMDSLTPVSGFEMKPDFENSCDSSECRYLYYHEQRIRDVDLQTTAASIGWGMEAIKATGQVVSPGNTGRIQIPVLLMQAGNDMVVKNEAQNLFASRVKSCELHPVPGMKHELFMTDSPVLIPYWEKIFAFLG